MNTTLGWATLSVLALACSVIITLGCFIVYFRVQDLKAAKVKSDRMQQWVAGFELGEKLGLAEAKHLYERNEFLDETSSFNNGVNAYINTQTQLETLK